jgi:flagellin-like protein
MWRGSRTPARRRRSTRAVSPIIATILLVAIAVVLAAVLYVLVSGLAHGSSDQPLAGAFYAGPAAQVVGSTALNAFCQSKHYCYSVPIDIAQSGLVLGDLEFKVVTASGVVHVVSENYGKIAIVNDQNVVEAYTQVAKNTPLEETSWEKFAAGVKSGSTVLPSETIWVQFGNTKTSPYGQGFTLEVVGTGAFTGTESIQLP